MTYAEYVELIGLALDEHDLTPDCPPAIGALLKFPPTNCLVEPQEGK